MTKYRAFLLVAMTGAMTSTICSAAFAETLQMDGTTSASSFEQPGKPTRGMTDAGVEAKFGAPSSRDGAIGEPPISRWEYADFVVFFEYDRVIHAVSKR